MQGELLLLLAFHVVVTGLPAAAAMLYLAGSGLRSVPVLLAAGLAAMGVAAMLTFWAFYLDPTVGETFAFFVLFGSAAMAAWQVLGGKVDQGLLRKLATPIGLWALGSAFLVFLGFVHGGIEHPLQTAGTRFSAGPLPSDSDIPHFFTEWFYLHGHHGTPPVYPGEWLFSDRPPLQVGFMLMQRPLVWKGNLLDYQLIGVLLQQLWIVAVWALLLAFRLGRVTRALIMVTLLASDVAIVNGFFVWPKLLPAAMLIAAAALVLSPLWAEVRRDLRGAMLVAALLALAMLGHGSSVFAVIPLAAVAAIRGLPSWRWIGAGVLVGVLLMAPWSAYQKYADPPGSRLTKWMLAGVQEIDGRTTTEAILDSYRAAGPGGTLHNKAENFVTIAGGGPMVDMARNAVESVGRGDWPTALRDVRTILFFYFLPSLGLLVLAPLLMLIWRRRGRESQPDWGFALSCWAVVGVGCVLWALIIFGSEVARAVLHVGSFALPLLALAGSVAGLRAVFPRLAIALSVAVVALSLAIYFPALEAEPGSSLSPLGLALCVLSLAGFLALAVFGRTPAGGRIGQTPRR